MFEAYRQPAPRLERAASALLVDVGQAVSLDGVNDGVNVPHSNALHPGDTLIMQGWIKRGATADAGFFCKTTNSYCLAMISNRLTLFQDGGPRIVTSTTTISDTTTFHHIAATKQASAVKLISTASTEPGRSPTRPSSPTQAASTSAATGINERFRGTLDEFAFYSPALSSSRIAAHYAAR